MPFDFRSARFANIFRTIPPKSSWFRIYELLRPNGFVRVNLNKTRNSPSSKSSSRLWRSDQADITAQRMILYLLTTRWRRELTKKVKNSFQKLSLYSYTYPVCSSNDECLPEK
jgi:hypothetical protein